jgi:hypothetical protein
MGRAGRSTGQSEPAGRRFLSSRIGTPRFEMTAKPKDHPKMIPPSEWRTPGVA